MRTMAPSLILTILAVIALSTHTHAADLYVDPVAGTDAPSTCLTGSECLTIGYAVSVATAGDTIHLLAGTYTQTGTVLVDKQLAFVSDTALAAVLVQDEAYSVFEVAAGSAGTTFTDVRFLITNGAVQVGGGLQVHDTTGIVVTGCLFTHNPGIVFGDDCVKFGAGISTNNAQVDVVSCTFTELQCCATGCGVYASDDSTLSISSSLFEANTVTGVGGVGGAGIYLTSATTTVTVSDTTFDRNFIDLRRGGGAHVANGGTGIFTDCTFSDNAALEGAGVYDISGQTQLTRCTFTSNTATNSGGAVGAFQSDLTIDDCIINSNSAERGGGVDVKEGAALLIQASSFDSNAAQVGAAMEVEKGTSMFVMRTTQISNHIAQDKATINVLNNDIEFDTVTFTNNRGLSGAGSIDLSGTSQARLSNSVLRGNTGEVGAGIGLQANTRVNITTTLFVDNVARGTGGAIYAAQNAIVDIDDTTFVTNTALSSGGTLFSFGDTLVTIRNSNVSAGISPYGGGCLYIDLNCHLEVYDSYFWRCFTVDGEGGAIYLRQSASTAVVGTTFFENSASIGGGIFATGTAAVDIQDSSFLGNSAGDGGGIYMDRSTTLTTDGTSFDSNYAEDGGAIIIFGEIRAEIRNSNFSNHKHASAELAAVETAATVFTGGAINCEVNGEVVVDNCRFEQNNVVALGGGIYAPSCVVNISDSYFADNDARTFGGAVLVDYRSLVRRSQFYRNSALWGAAIYVSTDDSQSRPIPLVADSHFEGNSADAAGGAVFWEGIQPIHVPSCQGCSFASNIASGYGTDQATAASIIHIIANEATEDIEASPPLSIPASQDFRVSVVITDFFNATVRYGATNAARTMTAEINAEAIPAGSLNTTVIGSNLVTVVDGAAEFTGLFLRGSRTQTFYNLVITTVPPSTRTVWRIYLEQCETGFEERPHDIFLFECLECPSGQFDLVRLSTCQTCPEGAVCEGLTRIFPLENWWWDPTSDLTRPSFYRCVPDRCCPVSTPENRCLRTRPCADGWNQTSRLCSRCIEGRYEWNNRCIECGGSERWRFLWVFVICVAFVGILFILGGKLGGEVRILIFFCQAMSLVIGPVHPSMPYFGMSMGFLDILSIDDKCFVRLTAFEKLVSSYAVPFLMLGVLTVICAGYVLWGLRRRKQIKARAGGEHVPWINVRPLIDAYINLFGICTIPLLHTSFQLLICRKVGKLLVVNLAPDKECYRGPHSKWVVFATCVTVFYLIVFPSLVFIRRRRTTQRILKQRFWQRSIGMLRANIYKLEMYWWELLLIGRDCMLVLMYVLWFSEPRRRSLSILMVLFIFFTFHAYGLPFKDSWDNGIETIALISLAYSSFVWHYPYRFQLSDEKTDEKIRKVFMYSGLLSTSTYVFGRVCYDIFGRFFLPLFHVEPVDYDVHHTPHL